MKIYRSNTKSMGKSVIIEVNRREAVELIQSLASQLASNSANIGRLESYSDKGEHLTIAVLHMGGVSHYEKVAS